MWGGCWSLREDREGVGGLSGWLGWGWEIGLKGQLGRGVSRAVGKGEIGKGVGSREGFVGLGTVVRSGAPGGLRGIRGRCEVSSLASAWGSGAVCHLAQGLVQPLHTHQTTSLLLETVQRAKCWRPWGCLRHRSSTANTRRDR